MYRPFFSPWHGLFRKKGGTGAGIRFLEFCDAIAFHIARYEKYRYWASKNTYIHSVDPALLKLLNSAGNKRDKLKGQMEQFGTGFR